MAQADNCIIIARRGLVNEVTRPIISGMLARPGHDDDVIKLGADIEVTSMRPEQDGSDHDYHGQVADTGCQLRYREPEEESLTITGGETRRKIH